MKTIEKLETVFSNNFKGNMFNKDLEGFKKDFPLLYFTVILPSLMEAYLKGRHDLLNRE